MAEKYSIVYMYLIFTHSSISGQSVLPYLGYCKSMRSSRDYCGCPGPVGLTSGALPVWLDRDCFQHPHGRVGLCPGCLWALLGTVAVHPWLGLAWLTESYGQNYSACADVWGWSQFNWLQGPVEPVAQTCLVCGAGPLKKEPLWMGPCFCQTHPWV